MTNKTPSEKEFREIFENVEYEISEKEILFYLNEAKASLEDSLNNFYAQRKRLELFGAFLVGFSSFLISSYFKDFFNPVIDLTSKIFLSLTFLGICYSSFRIVKMILPRKVHYTGNYPSSFIFEGYDETAYLDNLKGELINHQCRLIENEKINSEMAESVTEILISILVICILLMVYIGLKGNL